MARALKSERKPAVLYEQKLASSTRFKLREASEYFGGRGTVQQALKELSKRLDEENIPYAVLGALAMYLHGHHRMTIDIDLLMTKEGLERFRQRCLGKGYLAAFKGARKSFRDTERGIRVEVITAGEFPGDGKPKPVAFPDPQVVGIDIDGIPVVTLDKLIELKLASGMTAPHRLSDLADVLALVRSLHLPRELVSSLDPSVQEKYIELWTAAQTEDAVHEQDPNR